MSILAILFICLCMILSNFNGNITEAKTFSFKEITVNDIQIAFKQNRLSSRQLVEYYLGQIQRANPVLKGIIEVNPDALYLADKADQERKAKMPKSLSRLHGIPVLVKDNIATKDKLNTTAGSLALLGSIVPQDAGVVKKLRKVGAIILGKATMTEWAAFRSGELPSGWNARLGQALNPYVASADPSGSSTGSATSVAANMAAVALGTETAGSILSPSSANSVVGIKPTVGLTSRAGVVPISHRQDTVGPICRTVSDAVEVLEAIVGFDQDDSPATKQASTYIPHGGYRQFLKADGLRGKRLGITKDLFSSDDIKANQRHFKTLRQKGAVLVDNLEIPNINLVYTAMFDAQDIALTAEFKMDLNAYLKKLVHSRVRSLADVIAFNKISASENVKKFGQDTMLEAEKTNGIGKLGREALKNITKACKYGFEKMMKDNNLDALMSPGANIASLLAIGGYPGINVPAGYDKNGVPFGIFFGGLKGSEPTLIEIAYGFEQATHIRKPPPSHPR
ncbi:PREDICTED: putative amidase C869.01 [Nicotiana attenuata]|uniref:Glutamyl-trna(Gln) amidotransferase subunit a, chloroplasticmitochondrial n=1 Tax=Nicotiana attenuata TaxID=49451 RepID=A0A314LC58_NICAT|nr:PREDICTED: putative amidase C869.01 [Nicotiana attenuata]XP_019261261.1 PREDICTED: putative amidase C869.01 [Nicotiana attenuata]OIT38609.1 glutamyl-trna(gln) amidotransferase subunit a, chloroplasticmitochondrial [Nicotiana attenuata]